MAKSEKEIEIEIVGKEWEEALDKAFKKANKNAKIDGFRPGKAPKDVFIKKYGKQSLYMDAADSAADMAYQKLLKEHAESLYMDAADSAADMAYQKLLKEHADDVKELVARPDIALKDVNDEKIVFLFTLTTRPEVKLGKYKGLGIKKYEVKDETEEIEDAIYHMRERYAEDVIKDETEEIEDAIYHMRERYAEDVIKEGKIENGDIAVIDFEGFVDDKAFDGGKSENYSLKIGSGTFIPGFEEQLVGLKSGDKKDVKVTFPEDYHAEDLKGKEAIFKVTVHEVKEVKIPELDKDFFDDLGMEGINTKEELEAQVSENILARKEMEAENKYLDDLLEAASKNVKVDVPEAMINEELDRMVQQYADHLKMQGITIEQFYQFTNSDEQALKDQMRPEAIKRITYRLMLEEIAKEEKIEIDDKTAKDEAKKLAEKYQMKEDEFLSAFGGLDIVKYDMRMRQAMEILKK